MNMLVTKITFESLCGALQKKNQSNLTWPLNENATDPGQPCGEGEFLGGTIPCPLTAPSAPLQLLCMLQVQPWLLPQEFLQLFSGPWAPPGKSCRCGGRGSSPECSLVCRGGILSHSIPEQLSPCFPLQDLHSLASRAVSLRFLPLLHREK